MPEAQFPHPNCDTLGHHFFRADYVFAKDQKGTPFIGDGFKPAPKFARMYCSRCLLAADIEICPALEVRQPKFPKPAKLASLPGEKFVQAVKR